MAVDISSGSNALEYTHFTTGNNQAFCDAITGASGNPSFTVFARVKLNSTPGSLGAAIAKFGLIPPGFGTTVFFTLLGISSARLAYAHTRQFGGTATSAFLTPLEIGTWYNICGVWRNSSFRQIWVDGVSGASNTETRSHGNFEGLLIGAGHTSSSAFNRPLNACIQDVTIWARELTGVEILALNTTTDPSTLHQSDVGFHQPCADEATSTTAYTYLSGSAVAVPLFIDGTGGAITTCVDSYEVPETPVEEDCEGEDVADAEPTPETWDPCVFVPEDIDVQAVSETSTPGRSLSGRQQFVQRAAGHWRIELIGIPIWTAALVLQWRALEAKLDGRNGTILIPFYEGKLSATPIAATSTGDYAVGDVRMVIDQTAGADIRAGMHFSPDDDWGYRVKRVRTDEDGNTEITIWPPLREAIDLDEALDFNTPHVRCRLERDDGMALMLEHLRFGKHTVAFVEDV